MKGVNGDANVDDSLMKIAMQGMNLGLVQLDSKIRFDDDAAEAAEFMSN